MNNNELKGIIIRIEKQEKHLNLIREYDGPLWIMIDINHVEAFLNRNITAANFRENINIITTTTIDDDRLVNYFIEKEFEIINKFKPKYHIPCDFPVYDTQPNNDRAWFLKTYLSELNRIFLLLRGTGVEVIPLIKGTNPEERVLCYNTFKALGLKHYTYYVSSEFGPGKGRPTKKVSNDIRSIASEIKDCQLTIIGNQSIEGLKRLPPQVVSSAGSSQWRKYIKLGKVSLKESCKYLKEWKENTEKELSCGDDVLTN